MKEKSFELYLKQINKFLERIKGEVVSDIHAPQAKIYTSKLPVPYSKHRDGNFVPVKEGDIWGELWESAWFQLTFEIPQSWENLPVAFKLELGGEILLYQGDDPKPVSGLTHMSVFNTNYRKDMFVITNSAKPGRIEYLAEVGANGLFGRIDDGVRNIGNIRQLKIGVFHPEVWRLIIDIEFLLSLSRSLKTGDCRYKQIIFALHQAVVAYGNLSENASKARALLQPQLRLPATGSELTTVAVGHAHIDAAWLWPMRESIRKCGRTFASQLYYLKEYKDYVFGASQAQLYAFTREHYPELYQEIKDYVAEGRWEIQGGMWVEADCNIISGESMVRQFVHGKNFFRDEFGVDVKNLWLPDVFGYSAAMPQILKKSGCDYFLTQKISWNQFNQFPYHSFFWQGIDGNKVLTHFPPESNYNSPLEPEHLVKARNQYKENYLAPLFLTLFGMGNGGGGPKSETIENGLRAADVEGCPKVKFGRADDFFTQLEKYSELLPSWVGELYLEFHRGTLTSQGKSKLLNRRCEQILALTEFVCSCLPLDEYPDSELDKAWKTVLTNQFHDIIPGSSIREVYAVSEEELAGVLKLCEKLQTEAARKLLQADSQAITVVNTLSYPYTHAVRLPASWSNCEVFDENMSLIPTQSEDNGEVWGIGNFMPQSFTTLRRGKAVETQAKLVDTLVLENDLIRYEFNRNAHLISAFDKEAQRELIGKAGGNHLKLYVDRPHEWDAWDIDFDYEEHFLEEAIVTGISKAGIGKVRQTLRFELKVGASVLSQQMILSANSKRLDFVTVVQWREQHHMLRVNFDTTIDAPEAICDIQYGYVKRPTHTNTSWDFARFEVAAQRYVDISGPDGGVAMLNDCKYGHHLSSGALNLNLLRSPTSPDEIADQGEHTFTYSLLPHNGNFINSNVMPEAACLNRPPAVWEGALSAAMPCQVVKRSGVTLEVLKKAEKSNHRMIRCVENNGSNSSITLRFSDAKTLLETNLIEWEQLGEIYVENHLVTLNFKPFEIRTFIIK